jgi:hypothetical protein
MKTHLASAPVAFLSLDLSDLDLVAGGSLGSGALAQAAQSGAPTSMSHANRASSVTPKLMETLTSTPAADPTGASASSTTAHGDAAVSAALHADASASPNASAVADVSGTAAAPFANAYQGVVSSMGLNVDASLPSTSSDSNGGCHHHSDE